MKKVLLFLMVGLTGSFFNPLVALILGTCTISSSSWAAEEEYAPIPELNYVPPKVIDDSSIFDDMRMHAGTAFVTSYQDIPIGSNKRVYGNLRGLQINFGIDLFSPHWQLQGVLFSLPEASLQNAVVSSNGFELRLDYEDFISEVFSLHGLIGVASRNYGIRTAGEDHSFSSGSTVFGAGADYWFKSFLSAGLEITEHVPMGSSSDPSSFDFLVRVNGHF